MGAMAKLRELFARREPLLAPMEDPFIQIDREATSERLRLRERGTEQGALEQPPSHLRTLDFVEAEIATHVLEVYARAQSDAANSIRTYDGRSAELALLGSTSSIAASARLAVSDFRASVGNALNRLANRKDDIESSYSELREFCLEHGLRRPAHRALSGPAGWGAIVGAWGVETLLNASLLRQNDDMGYLGGVVAAGTIGALNVGIAAVVGRLVWPQTLHRAPMRKVIGWTVTALWIVLMLVWNVGAAHYRDAKVSGVENPEVQALAMMSGAPDSIYSWALLLAGILFAALAALSGFRMDDPYPGFGRVSRRHDERCDAYASAVESATAELQEIRDEAVDEVASVRDELAGQAAERGQILAARAAFVRRFDEFSNQLEVIANSLLQDYRAANQAARSTPSPPTFSTPWVLPRTVLPPPPPLPVSETDIRSAETMLDRAIGDLSSAFDEAVGAFEPLDALKRKLSDA
ncbi:hypothetical protein Q0812_11850 [Brevundimonas sp. 2R-24]|uniref:Transmembrane protein n=1 Tax=Peiella sedimenti TaxID=3061083 RepID=A0ABT8SPN6_9CAUL|nr:hypothetical protein [Caulobacteraceae bacterium XZ-24]